MNDNPKRRGSLVGVLLVTGAILLPILYILSFGPVFSLLPNSPYALWAFKIVYAPVLWLMENGPRPVDAWLASYFAWWNSP